jgi:hypothetical protein
MRRAATSIPAAQASSASGMPSFRLNSYRSLRLRKKAETAFCALCDCMGASSRETEQGPSFCSKLIFLLESRKVLELGVLLMVLISADLLSYIADQRTV